MPVSEKPQLRVLDFQPVFHRGDANGDGQINITDGIFILNFLFLGGAPLPAPGVESCGVDSTEDALDCLDQTPCN